MGKILDDLKSYWTFDEPEERIFETGALFVPAEKWERVGEALGVLHGGYVPKQPDGTRADFEVVGYVDAAKDGIFVEWTLEGGDEGLAERLLGYLDRAVDRANAEPGREVYWVSRGSSRKKNTP